MSKARICIDAGHGYNTPGKHSCPLSAAVSHKYGKRTVKLPKGYQLKEHCANAGVAEYLEQELIKRGYEVVRSGYTTATNWRKDICPEDPDDDVRQRQKVIRASGCDLSVSLHFDAFGDGVNYNSAEGISVLYRSDAALAKDSKVFASAVYKRVSKVIPWQRGRGLMPGSWGMCNADYMKVKAAIIIEHAFMTNKREAEQIFCDPSAWYGYAVAIADGIDAYMT